MNLIAPNTQPQFEVTGSRKLQDVERSLNDGLTLLQDLLYDRLREDMEQSTGVDSMLVPVSPIKAEQDTRREIELYQAALVVDQTCLQGYAKATEEALAKWVTGLRLPRLSPSTSDVESRVLSYLELPPQRGRLAFTNALVKAFPEASRAPLVLFRLFPLSVRAVTSIAFGDHPGAAEIRNRQVSLLPPIADCHMCHGRPLDTSETCQECSNPVWSYRWLNAT